MTFYHLNRRPRRGSNLIEFALILPVAVLLIFGIFENGCMYTKSGPSKVRPRRGVGKAHSFIPKVSDGPIKSFHIKRGKSISSWTWLCAQGHWHVETGTFSPKYCHKAGSTTYTVTNPNFFLVCSYKKSVEDPLPEKKKNHSQSKCLNPCVMFTFRTLW